MAIYIGKVKLRSIKKCWNRREGPDYCKINIEILAAIDELKSGTSEEYDGIASRVMESNKKTN